MSSDHDFPSEERIRSIPGNAPIEVKGFVGRWLYMLANDGFGAQAMQSLELVEVSVVNHPDEPAKREARVVLETTVTEDMMSPGGHIHGGCIAHLANVCTTLPITAISFVKGQKDTSGVSLNMNIIYHAPAGLDDRLRLINTTTSVGARVRSARTEIWDVTNHRLVASATHVKMDGSSPKL